MRRFLLLPLLLVTILSSAASAQENGFASEAEIVVSRRYAEACEKNLVALEEAGRWVDVAEGEARECRARARKDAERIEALVRENEGLRRDAPSRWVWFGAGMGSTVALVLLSLLVFR